MQRLRTTHTVLHADARDLSALPDASVHLVVTSPPYPMIGMWDATFAALSADAADALDRGDGAGAFEAQHRELDRVWRECWRVLVPGGVACVNIGDATRTLGGVFRLYPNHARIVSAAMALGFDVLPDILWRKPTNAPTKFMGSGMLPAGAYVTYEHEYILVLRKGAPRRFRSDEEKRCRRRSAYFWEERNVWFSDVWEGLTGAPQRLDTSGARTRSGAFPFELAYRLVSMFSLQGDTVLDPFLGTGTTITAAIACARSSVGVERDEALLDAVRSSIEAAPGAGRARARERLQSHVAAMEARTLRGQPPRHTSEPYGFPVVTAQERGLVVYEPVALRPCGEAAYEAEHEPAGLGAVRPGG